MMKSNVFNLIKFKDIPSKANILTSTWDIKKKYSGVNIESLNALGYEKFYGVHYDSDNMASPVTNDRGTKIVLVSAMMAAQTTNILDIIGLFLRGDFTENEEPIQVDIPQEFENVFEE